MSLNLLRDLAYNSLLNLSTADGFNASGREEIYGCIFGRDSALTILKILKVHAKTPAPQLLDICRRALITLVGLQGKLYNRESGEAPGKYIHEFRKDKQQYLHLLNQSKPWYIYEDETLKNYDSIDSTPLTLIAIYRYFQITHDRDFLLRVLTSVQAGLGWIMKSGDLDGDSLLEYELPADRIHGGLTVQSWTDSNESLVSHLGKFPCYPIAPVEVQGYAWLALKLWADYFMEESPDLAGTLVNKAGKMKDRFNRKFLFRNNHCIYAGQALDGNKKLIRTVTGNPLLLLWATYFDNNGNREAIIDEKTISDIVKRSMQPDLFDSQAGIRTMSTKSLTYNPAQDSYHNGSFWPILNGLAHEGLVNWGYLREADFLKQASVKPLEYFRTPIELYIRTSEGKYQEYCNSNGQKSCRVQAWSAAAFLDFFTN
jgi:glycogen debranching enzyme